MKLFWVYWIFLFISIISSSLLFIIVASEGLSPVSKGKLQHDFDNVTLDDTGQNDLFYSYNLLKLNKVDTKIEEKPESSVLKDHEATKSKEASEITQTERLNIVKESLIQQPNLSQGISETGQAIVLTLVDTASAELQNLADPQLQSDKESQLSSGNLTNDSTLKTFETETTINLPSASSLPPNTAILTDNGEKNSSESVETVGDKVEKQNEEVTIVRAKQRQPEEDQSAEEKFPKAEEVAKSPEEAIKLENPTQTNELDESVAKAKVGSGSSDEATAAILDNLIISTGSEPHEDIPSFSEWAQKRLEEAEKKKTHPNASIQNPGNPGRNVGMKIRSKNYASVDCGAKIVGVNPEAGSAKSILLSNRDEYMLNTCTSRIWFVVELCEAIQAKKIELANFELFSSSPKDFSVYISDRYPTRDWSIVGQFTGKDERDIQSFQLNPHLFGKFIKIELHSHYGSEHFCPISLFRAYGTSEFEVLDTENEIQESLNNDNSDDDDDDDSENINDDEQDNDIKNKNIDNSRNLFGSATDAVIRIVKKAAEVLVKSSDNNSNSNSNNNNITNVDNNSSSDNNKNIIDNTFVNCITLKYKNILCYNCTDDYINNIKNILSCRYDYFQSLYNINLIKKTLYQSELCELNNSKSTSNNNRIISERFFKSFFSKQYIIILCNILAINNKLLNITLINDNVINNNINDTNVNNNDLINNNNKKEDDSNVNDDKTASVSGEIVSASASVIEVVSFQTETVETTQKPQVTFTCLPDKTNCNLPGKQMQQDSFKQIDENSLKIETNHLTKTSEIISQIKPTKTLLKEDVKKESSGPILEPSKETAEETMQAEVLTTPSPLINLATASLNTLESLSSSSPSPSLPSSQQTLSPSASTLLAESVSQTITPQVEEESVLKVEEKELKIEEKLKENDEIKLSAQEQMSLDSLLSDLESDPLIQSVSSSSVVASQSQQAPQQKESVFIRLSNRIKALERNMSLSGQYLEELSKRYKKQVEEMQRSLERAITTMNDEFKKNEEKEVKRNEELTILKNEISSLSKSLETLLYDRNSWRNKFSTFGQHIAFIFIEVIFIIIIIFYCRKNSDIYDYNNVNNSKYNGKNDNQLLLKRRSSAESIVLNDNNSKKKHRRPSEIASKITGTYDELMINDEGKLYEAKKKRKRKKESVPNLSNVNRDLIKPPRRHSSNDPPTCPIICDIKRPESAPSSTNVNWSDDNPQLSSSSLQQNRKTIDEIDSQINNFFSKTVVEDNNQDTIPRFGKFMRTALKNRSKRDKNNLKLSADNFDWYPTSPTNFPFSNGSKFNGNTSKNTSEDSESDISQKKVKKEHSLKKMVKKFF